MSSSAESADSDATPAGPPPDPTAPDPTSPADLTAPPPAVDPKDVPSPVKKLAMHMPQLDSVRGVSAWLIITYHYTASVATDYGIILLGIFFLLSGFLITGILLDAKTMIETGRITFFDAIKTFFARRVVRIFPMYYGTVLLLWLIDFRGMPERVWWHLTYMSNYYFSYKVNQAQVNKIPERHLWSLSVEEQFYLVWPFLIFLIPRKLLPWLFALFILGAPVYRIYTYVPKTHRHEWMTPCCLDLLAAGATLALLYKTVPRETVARILRVAGVIGITLLATYIAFDYFEVAYSSYLRIHAKHHAAHMNIWARAGEWVGLHFPSRNRVYYNYSIIAIFGFWLIGTAANGFKGAIGWLLTSSVARYSGKISYGLYVFHMFTPYFVRWVSVKWFNYDISDAAHARMLGWICFPLTVMMASASWHFFESPLNDLKRFFTYKKKPVAA